MTNVIKHALKYQEYRRTLFLNLMGKDDFGRHRGQVLYGMELTPVGTSVRIRPGAFITPYGTRFYWDVVNADDPSINTIDLATLQIDGQGILDTYNDIRRPIMVAIVARATPEEPARQPGVENETDMGANSIEFAAFVVAHSRATSQPTLHLPPLNPVEMDEEQTGLQTNYDYIKTWDVPSVNSTVALLAGNPATESLGVNDVLLGYVTIGCSSSGTPVRTLQSGSTWAAGVSYVPARNAWQSLMDFLGFDPLLGRVSMPINGPVIGSASPAAEGTLVKFQAGAGAGLGTTTYLSPKFGTPAVFSDAAPWIGDWKDYRPPSFLKDGEQLIWQLRRLDTFLRLWMDRTGDQLLIQLIQDGGHADTSWQTPLHRMLQVFTGLNGVGAPNKNLNALTWPDGAPGASQPVDNHALKSGVAGHLDRGLAVLASEFGDSHAAAIAALDWAIWHLLQDVIGFGLGGRPGVDRSSLRSTGAWTRSSIPGLAHAADAPHAGRPVLVVGAATAYLDTEPALTAVTEVAKRTSAEGTNLLRNPGFQAGDGNSQVEGEIPFWTRDGASTWSRGDLITALQVKQLSLTLDSGNRQVFQRLDDANLAAVLTVGEPLSVAATLKVTSGTVELILRGQTSGGGATVFEAKSQPLAVMAGFETHSFSFKPTSVTGVARLELIVRSSDGSNAAVILAGMWAGPGQPPLNPALQSMGHDFLSRDGGVLNALRGDLDLGTHKLLRVANGTVATDGINKGQLDSAVSGEVLARNQAIADAVAAEALLRSQADSAEALARANGDSGLQSQIDVLAGRGISTFSTGYWDSVAITTEADFDKVNSAIDVSMSGTLTLARHSVIIRAKGDVDLRNATLKLGYVAAGATNGGVGGFGGGVGYNYNPRDSVLANRYNPATGAAIGSFNFSVPLTGYSFGEGAALAVAGGGLAIFVDGDLYLDNALLDVSAYQVNDNVGRSGGAGMILIYCRGTVFLGTCNANLRGGYGSASNAPGGGANDYGGGGGGFFQIVAKTITGTVNLDLRGGGTSTGPSARTGAAGHYLLVNDLGTPTVNADISSSGANSDVWTNYPGGPITGTPTDLEKYWAAASI